MLSVCCMSIYKTTSFSFISTHFNLNLNCNELLQAQTEDEPQCRHYHIFLLKLFFSEQEKYQIHNEKPFKSITFNDQKVDIGDSKHR